jgi:hypothetical protein
VLDTAQSNGIDDDSARAVFDPANNLLTALTYASAAATTMSV